MSLEFIKLPVMGTPLKTVFLTLNIYDSFQTSSIKKYSYTY